MVCWVTMAINIVCMFVGILKNPGIPQAYLDRIMKEKPEEDDPESDLEENEPGLRKRKNFQEKKGHS